MISHKAIEDVITPSIEKGLNSLFFKALSEGQLAQATYDKYLLQDKIYLLYYRIALMSIAHTTPLTAEKAFFLESAHSIQSEPAISKSEHQLIFATPISLKYIDYLMRYCHDKREFAIASVFPCFYFYFVMAKSLYPKDETHPFKDWFDCYTGDTFVTQTQTISKTINKLFNTVTDQEKWLRVIQEGFELEYDFHQFEIS